MIAVLLLGLLAQAGSIGPSHPSVRQPPSGAQAGTFLQSGSGATLRTIESKLRDEGHVKDQGAVCDGVTSDSTPMQNASDAAGNTKAVVIPANCVGDYTYSSSVATLDYRAFKLNGAQTFTGDAGSRTTGAPRILIGRGTFSGDDSAILINRTLAGDSLFSHAFRDESTLNFTTTGAYAVYDAIPVMNGTIHYNHLRGFQSRIDYEGSGTIDEVASFSAQPKAGAGTVTNLYGLKVADAGVGGTVTNQYGIWIDTLSRGGSNFGIFVQGNPSFLGGNLQISGTLTGVSTGAFSGEITANSIDTTGTPAAFNGTGGVGVYGYAGNAYGKVKAFSNSSGTEKILALNDAGVGGVTIGSLTSGDKVSGMYRGTATLATAAITANLCAAEQSITVTGAAAGAECLVGMPTTIENGLIWSCYVSAANTTKLRLCNHTAGNITPAAAQTVAIRVLNP